MDQDSKGTRKRRAISRGTDFDNRGNETDLEEKLSDTSEESGQESHTANDTHGEGRKAGGHSRRKFTSKLKSMIEKASERGKEDVIRWQSDGLSFRVYEPEEFAETILPHYFRMTSYRSFQRQLYLYNFSRIREGPNQDSYMHPLFRRDDDSHLEMVPEKSKRIKRQPTRREKRLMQELHEQQQTNHEQQQGSSHASISSQPPQLGTQMLPHSAAVSHLASASANFQSTPRAGLPGMQSISQQSQPLAGIWPFQSPYQMPVASDPRGGQGRPHFQSTPHIAAVLPFGAPVYPSAVARAPYAMQADRSTDHASPRSDAILPAAEPSIGDDDTNMPALEQIDEHNAPPGFDSASPPNISSHPSSDELSIAIQEEALGSVESDRLLCFSVQDERITQPVDKHIFDTTSGSSNSSPKSTSV